MSTNSTILKNLALLLILLSTSWCLTAQTVTWDGGAGTSNWEDATNWMPDGVPSASNDVVIASGQVTIASAAAAASVKVENGASLTISTGHSLTVDNTPTGVPNQVGAIHIVTDASLTNNGILTVTEAKRSGVRVNSAMFANTGTTTITNYGADGMAHRIGFFATTSAQISNAAGATLSITSNATANNTNGVYNDNFASFTNSGSISVQNIAGTSSNGLVNLATFTNASTGSLSIDGVANSNGIYNYSSNATLTNHGSITVSNVPTSSEFLNQVGATYTGTGSFTGTEFFNTAILSPGTSPGTTTITGSFTQNSAGSYKAEIAGNGAGTGYDQVMVNGAGAGNITLNGTLDVTLLGGFTPGAADTYVIMSYTGTRTGQFATVNLPSPAMDGWVVDYDDTNKQVVLKSGTCTNALNTWTGSTPNDNTWESAGNWSLNHVPLACEDVVIDGAHTVTIASAALAASVKVQNGASLTIGTGHSLSVDNTPTGVPNQVGAVYISGNTSSLTNNGTLTVTEAKKSGVWVQSAMYTNAGTTTITNYGTDGIIGRYGFFATNSAQISNAAGATLSITSNTTANLTHGVNLQGSSSCSNSGSISVQNIAGTNSQGIQNAASFTNASTGSISINGVANSLGIFNYSTSATFTNNGSITSTNVAGSEFYNYNGANYAGTGSFTGTVFANSGTSGNQGILSPGTSPGTTTITGSLEQTNFGSYKAEIAGNGGAGVATGHDQVAVNGAVGNISLNGTLDVTLLGGFTPGAADTYVIMTYTGTRTGQFATVNFPSPAMDGWIVDYDDTNKQVVLKSGTCTNALNTWTGSTPNDNTWESAGNWSLGHKPKACEDVVIASGQVTIASAALAASVKVENGASLTIGTGHSLTVDNTPTGVPSQAGAILILTDASLTNNGTLTVTEAKQSGVYVTSAMFANAGTTTITNYGADGMAALYGFIATTSAQISNAAGATLSITSNATANNTNGVYNDNFASFTNSGSISVQNIAGTSSRGLVNTASFTNASTGSISIDGVANSHGIRNSSPNAIFTNIGSITTTNVSGTEFRNVNGASYTGTGSFTGTEFFNTAILSPGTSPGTTTITGSLTQTTGSYKAEIAGNAGAGATNGHDQVVVNGAVGNIALSGNLDVTLLGGFTPGAADTYVIMTYTGTRSGQFATVNLPSPAMDGWIVDYDDTNKEVVLKSGTCTNALNTWTGSTPNDNTWESAGNWSLNHVPLACEDVVINGAHTVTIASAAVAASVKVENGASLTIGTGHSLTVDNTPTGVPNQDAILILTDASLTNNGTLTVTEAKRSGVYVVSGMLTNSGLTTITNYGADGMTNRFGLRATSSAQISNAAGATLSITSNTTATNSDGISNGNPSNFTNSGSISVQNIAGIASEGLVNLATFTNASTGSISIDGVASSYGLVNITTNATFTNHGSITVSNVPTSSEFLNQVGATCAGTGSFTGTEFFNTAILSPGTSPGTTTITGSLTQNTAGSYKAEIAGNAGAGAANGHDQVVVNGAVGNISLDGTLDVTLLGGFTPGAADTYVIMTYTGTRTGQFATVNLPSPAMDGWIVDYDDTNKEVVLKSGVCMNAFNNWTGNASDGNWESDGNWSLGHKPKACEDVTIATTQVNINSSAVAASLKLYNGAFLNINTGNSLTIDNTPSSVVQDGALYILSNAMLNNSGTITVSEAKQSGIYINTGTFTNEGMTTVTNYGTDGEIKRFGLYVENSNQISNAAGASLTITSNAITENTDGLSNQSSTFTNSGNITINSIGGPGSDGISNSSFFTNEVGATISIDGVSNSFGIRNTTAANTTFTNNGNITVLNVSSAAFRNQFNATYKGTGSFTGSLFQNGINSGTTATLSPGTSPGTTTITGSLEQASFGAYKAEIAGNAGEGASNGHDQVVVNGAVGNITLDGTLDVTLLGGFTPGTADSYVIMTYTGTRTGQFATVNLPSPAMDGWIVDYDDINKQVVLKSGTCTHPDYAALEAFYNSTNGSGWTTSTGWLSDCNPCNWHGITCDANDRVSAIVLNDNNLTGTIPASIGDFTELVNLDLGDLDYTANQGNQIGGSIPTSIGQLTKLTSLNLVANSLTGNIPTEIGMLSNLNYLYLHVNNLSGSIPTEIGNLTGLLQLNIRSNQLTGSIPTSISNLTNLTHLYLYNNQLSGGIPASLTTLGNLSHLNLYDNTLSGDLPSGLGNMTSLQHLRLHNNQFTGSIPASMKNLVNLTQFTLYNNMLSGCYDEALKTSPSVLCNFTNANISLGNTFDAPWEDFCTNDAGKCPPCTVLTNTWVGTTSGSWHDAANWSNGVPQPCHHVDIPSAVASSITITISQQAYAASINVFWAGIEVTSTGYLHIDGDVPGNNNAGYNRARGNLTNHGTIEIDNTPANAFHQFHNSSFDNHGLLKIDNVTGHGMAVQTSMTNHATGTIQIGTEVGSNITGNGIYSLSAEIVNHSTMHIKNCGNHGLEASGGGSTNIVNNNELLIENTTKTSIRVAGCIVTNNHTMTLTGATNGRGLELIGTSQLKGSSTLTGSVHNLGLFDNIASISPGASPGLISVVGNYEQGSSGSYKAEIAGNGGAGASNGHDQVAVTGDVSLGGTLDVSFLGGFTPAAGDTYTLLTYTGTRTGTFATVTGLPAGWIVSYDTPGQVRIGPEAVLPIELITFEAALKGRTTVLKWTTATEINNDYFKVMHSIDGRDWTSIGSVDGMGSTSTNQKYSYLHSDPSVGVNYYRLKQVDYDGSFSYSTIVNVRLNTLESVLYPNPVIDLVNIDLPTGTSCDYVVIYNSLGKIVLHSRFERKLDVRHLPQGIYYLEARNNGIPLLKERFILK